MDDKSIRSPRTGGGFDAETDLNKAVFAPEKRGQLSAREILERAARKKNIPKEASVVKTILRRLNSLPGCKAEKVHGGQFGKRGKPDITGCVLGRRFDIEVKVGKNKPTPSQESEIEGWKSAGSISGWVTSWAEVVALFRAHGLDVEAS